MSKEICKDCGMLLSPHSNVCTVCGYDNSQTRPEDRRPELTLPNFTPNTPAPENYPGY